MICVQGTIYLATNNVNDKKYVGQTIQKMEDRIYQHKVNHYGYSLFHSAIEAYGFENFEWKILKENIDNQKDLNLSEQFWINKLNTQKWGYNVYQGKNKIKPALTL